MNINRYRQVAAGRAGVGVYVGQYLEDGPVTMTPIVRPGLGGNGPCWTGPDQRRVFLDYFPSGLAECDSDGGNFDPFDPPQAATSYGASDDGLSWAFYLADMGTTGIQTAWGLSLPHASWGESWAGGAGIGPALFVLPNQGTGLESYPIGSKVPSWALPAAQPLDFFAIDESTVIWTQGDNRLYTRNIPVPPQFESINAPTSFVAAGRRWLTYIRGQGGAVIRPWDDATHGYIVVPVGQNAYGFCTTPGDAQAHVIAFWSPNAGETEIHALTVNLTARMQDLQGAAPVVPNINHDMFIGGFFPSR